MAVKWRSQVKRVPEIEFVVVQLEYKKLHGGFLIIMIAAFIFFFFLGGGMHNYMEITNLCQVRLGVVEF